MTQATIRSMVRKNLRLSLELSSYFFAHPEALEKIPTKSHIIMLTSADKPLSDFNIRWAKDNLQKQKQPIYKALHTKLGHWRISPLKLVA